MIFQFHEKNNIFFLDEGEFATSQQLGILAKVLAGDDSTFKDEVYHCIVYTNYSCLFTIYLFVFLGST